MRVPFVFKKTQAHKRHTRASQVHQDVLVRLVWLLETAITPAPPDGCSMVASGLFFRKNCVKKCPGADLSMQSPILVAHSGLYKSWTLFAALRHCEYKFDARCK